MSTTRTSASFNGETLSLDATASGSVGISQRWVNGATTITLSSSSNDLSVTATGNHDAVVIGTVTDDRFDFSRATGDYTLVTQEGNDTIIEGVGNNVLDGGDGKDNLIFTAEGGSQEVDHVLSFVVGDDRIAIRNATVLPVPQQTGPDQVTITLSDGDRIVVQGTGIASANAQDYLFLA